MSISLKLNKQRIRYKNKRANQAKEIHDYGSVHIQRQPEDVQFLQNEFPWRVRYTALRPTRPNQWVIGGI